MMVVSIGDRRCAGAAIFQQFVRRRRVFRQATVRIPIKVRGQGIKKGDRVGAQIVEVEVSVPDELSVEEQKAMEEFATASGLRH